MSLYRRWIHRRERRMALRDPHRRVHDFDWGLEWLGLEALNSQPPLSTLRSFAAETVRASDAFFTPPPLSDWELKGQVLRFGSPCQSRDRLNNRAQCRLFESPGSRRAVVVIPQWNAESDSHVGLCRILQRLGITALRLTLPYHENRRPPGMRRADFMVSPNLGRTLQTIRQAVLEVRQAAAWLRRQGYRQVAVMGTSIGSCVGYLAFVHDRSLQVGIFNHVSGFFADVVWTGLSTRFIRWGLEEKINLPQLRECWAPISPLYFVTRLQGDSRRHLLIWAKYDLTFLPKLSEQVFQHYRQLGIRCDHVSLPCGHYTTARFPFNYLDGWHICRYLQRHLCPASAQ